MNNNIIYSQQGDPSKIVETKLVIGLILSVTILLSFGAIFTIFTNYFFTIYGIIATISLTLLMIKIWTERFQSIKIFVDKIEWNNKLILFKDIHSISNVRPNIYLIYLNSRPFPLNRIIIHTNEIEFANALNGFINYYNKALLPI